MLGGKPGSRRWKSAAAKRLLAFASTETIPDAVKVVVNRLLEGVACPPTNLEQLGLRLNVRRIRFEELPVAGALVPLDPEVAVLPSADSVHPRQIARAAVLAQQVDLVSELGQGGHERRVVDVAAGAAE